MDRFSDEAMAEGSTGMQGGGLEGEVKVGGGGGGVEEDEEEEEED